ncbi:MAG: DUF5808 domain-containing protein [Janthinobacterium lividum]
MNSLNRTNPQFWKWGMFYNNPNDGSLIIPKLSGLGWTFNFAHKNAYWFMIALMLIVLLGIYFIK